MKILLFTSFPELTRHNLVRSACAYLADWVRDESGGGFVWDFEIVPTNAEFTVVDTKASSGTDNVPTFVSNLDSTPIRDLAAGRSYGILGIAYAPEDYKPNHIMAPLEFDGALFQIPIVTGEDLKTACNFLCHEILHGCYSLSGLPDDVHQHSGLEDPRPEANYSDIIQKLKPWWSQRPNATEQLRGLLNQLSILIRRIMEQYKPSSKIIAWAQAIKEFEGWYEPGQYPQYPNGSRSYRNNNPGNLKFANQTGATGADEQNHAIFDTFEHGWNALVNQLIMAATGKSKAYTSDMSLYTFFFRYSERNSKAYAEFVAKKLGVSPLTPITLFV